MGQPLVTIQRLAQIQRFHRLAQSLEMRQPFVARVLYRPKRFNAVRSRCFSPASLTWVLRSNSLQRSKLLDAH